MRAEVLFAIVALVVLDASSTRADELEEQEDDGSHHHHFSYDKPEEWKNEFPICGGKRQSPINIELQDVSMMEATKPPLVYAGYEATPQKMNLTNDGHSVLLKGVWPPAKTPTIYGGPLTGIYELFHVHFHWGTENSRGSEHTVGNLSFIMEMHMVHYKKSYGNLDEALKHADGIAVIGYFFSLDKNANMGFEKIKVHFPKIMKPKQSVDIESFPLTLFDLDLLKEGYVTYLGSLTTPPCSESVIWLISVRIKDITVEELDAFKKLELDHKGHKNCRPPQPRNNRPIYYQYATPK